MSGEHAYAGSGYTPRQPLYFASLSDTTAAKCGVGMVYAGGVAYWCDGSAFKNPVLVSAPAAANSSGVAGQIAYDATHIYVCVDTNTWVRATLATWS